MRSGIVLAAAAMTASPVAAEVVLTFGVEQRFEAGQNIDLSVPEGGDNLVARTRLSFGAVSRTQLDTLEFSSSAALVAENSDDTDGTEFEFGNPDLAVRYTREIPNALFSIGAQYRRDDVESFDEDLTIDDLDGTRTDSTVDLRFETGRTAPLGFVLFSSYTESEYTDTSDPDLVDNNTFRVGIETPLRFSEVFQASIRLGYEREEDTSPPLTLNEVRTAGLGLAYAMVNGAATADLDFRSDDEEGDRTTLVFGRALTLPAGSLSLRLGVTQGDIGGTDLVGGVTWAQELPRGGLEVVLERTVVYDDITFEPSIGTLLAVSFTQEINDLSSMGLTASHEVSDSPTERIELSQFAATYRYALTQDWNLDSGVRYRVRRDEDGRSDSPDVFVALSRSFEFRP
ncbi:hypothetical protein EI545_17680 [Tabrizicola piscis]|uniref:Outer membrane protein beta-barrel domain-containing protein n=1 Tax=Tabrizicola piscis TaxID=2494374 RepID=A0A3S8UA82_9RHOB|nr:hypothetical protein [Tabrizicola piscis]AZL60493.1 hypothetical protein EI545_17680 [Tabrizicola piscis]